MDPVILAGYSPQIDAPALASRLHVRAGSDAARELEMLIREAEGVARPKAIYRVAAITGRDETGVEIEGVRMSSRVLTVNLENAYRVFAYVATCGKEVDAWASTMDDLLRQFWGEAIKEAVLRSATRYLNTHLNDRFQLGKTSTMNPGSLLDWPLREQRPLFSLLGDPESSIGVSLASSYLMLPNKSVSGIRFPVETTFESCQLCNMQDCPGRRAPFEKDLYDNKYQP